MNPKVAIVCPSAGRECGIARYSEYYKEALIALGTDAVVLRALDQALRQPPDVVIFNHEYALTDSLNPSLSGRETISEILAGLRLLKEKGSKVSFIIHTFVDHNHDLLGFINKQIFSSGIPVFTHSSAASLRLGITYLDLGVHNYTDPDTSHEQAIIRYDEYKRRNADFWLSGFGLLGPNKRPDRLVRLAAKTNSCLCGNYATNDLEQVANFKELVQQRGIRKHSLHFDFANEHTIIKRLSKSSIATAFQSPIPHYATSGSLRFLLNLGCPVIADYGKQFEDISCARPCQDHERALEYITSLKDDRDFYLSECQKVLDYRKSHDTKIILASLLNHLEKPPLGAHSNILPLSLTQKNAKRCIFLPEGPTRYYGEVDPRKDKRAQLKNLRSISLQVFRRLYNSIGGSPLEFEFRYTSLAAFALVYANMHERQHNNQKDATLFDSALTYYFHITRDPCPRNRGARIVTDQTINSMNTEAFKAYLVSCKTLEQIYYSIRIRSRSDKLCETILKKFPIGLSGEKHFRSTIEQSGLKEMRISLREFIAYIVLMPSTQLTSSRVLRVQHFLDLVDRAHDYAEMRLLSLGLPHLRNAICIDNT